MKDSLVKRLGKGAGTALVAGLAFLSSPDSDVPLEPNQANAEVVVSIDILSPTHNPNGSTVYTAYVYADTTAADVNSIYFIGSEWDITVPSYITIVGADLPDNTNNPSQNASDFFYDEIMESNPGGMWNRVDSSVSSGELADNFRSVDEFSEPTLPIDRYGLLGSIDYTVNVGTSPGLVTPFVLNDVEFVDEDYNSYRESLSNLVTTNDSVSIIPEPSTLYGLGSFFAFAGAGYALSRRRKGSIEDNVDG